MRDDPGTIRNDQGRSWFYLEGRKSIVVLILKVKRACKSGVTMEYLRSMEYEAFTASWIRRNLPTGNDTKLRWLAWLTRLRWRLFDSSQAADSPSR